MNPHQQGRGTKVSEPYNVGIDVSIDRLDVAIRPGGRAFCVTNDAAGWAELLAQQEGIFVGITAGATFAGALQVCHEAAKGSTVLCMLPDTGERYLSTLLFADIPAEMTPDELKIARSTPSAVLGS
jgi:hypothetical protein